MIQLNRESTLGEVVAKYPSTIQVLNRYKIDYCCGGKDLMGKVLEQFNELESTIENELNVIINSYTEGEKSVKNWKEESLSNIIDYILSKHHQFVRDTLSELNELVVKILKVHYKSHGESLLTLHQLFGKLKTELEAHLIKEEENLFPCIIEYEKTGNQSLKDQIKQFIRDTEKEHDEVGDLLKEIERITDDFTPPTNACFSFRRTYELLDALEKDIFNHIHMENSILFELI